MSETFHTGGVVPSGAEFALWWTPLGGDPVEVPLGQIVKLVGGEGSFTLAVTRHHLPAAGAARIAEAVLEATKNPGRTVLVDDPWNGFPLEGDEVQR
jgi:hypothetical protein